MEEKDSAEKESEEKESYEKESEEKDSAKMESEEKDSDEKEYEEKEKGEKRKHGTKRKREDEAENHPSAKKRKRSLSKNDHMSKKEKKMLNMVERLKKIIRGCGGKVTGISKSDDIEDQIRKLRDIIRESGLDEKMTNAQISAYREKHDREKELESLMADKIAKNSPTVRGDRKSRNKNAVYFHY